MKETGWEGCADRILELHRAGPGTAPAAREAVAELQTEGERLIGLIHRLGPGKIASRCTTCTGRTTACGRLRDADADCQYNELNTLRKISTLFQSVLDSEWVSAHGGKTPGANKFG
jgi:hypothetical protein